MFYEFVVWFLFVFEAVDIIGDLDEKLALLRLAEFFRYLRILFMFDPVNLFLQWHVLSYKRDFARTEIHEQIYEGDEVVFPAQSPIVESIEAAEGEIALKVLLTLLNMNLLLQLIVPSHIGSS